MVLGFSRSASGVGSCGTRKDVLAEAHIRVIICVKGPGMKGSSFNNLKVERPQPHTGSGSSWTLEDGRIPVIRLSHWKEPQWSHVDGHP